jgi:Zn-dependent peptidase ImmA (M78 family)/transcriptional regulator with XRE-family HTH domain
MTNLSRVNGDMLKWGRERAMLTQERVAQTLRASVDEVEAWEASQSRITLKKAMDFARAVHIPFGYLYLSSPPKDLLPIPDLRRRGTMAPSSTSVDFRDVVQDVTLKQQWFRSLKIAEGADPLPFVGKFDISAPINVVAKDIRDTLGFDAESRRATRGAADLLRFLVGKAEEVGILVMRSGVVGSNNTRKLSVSEFSGFVMSDSVAPVVFVNVNDSSTAQVFTCIHELVHIWIGKSGISTLDTDPDALNMPDTEEFCNAVAAEVLIPESEFQESWRTTRHSIEAMASHFRVSQQVALRRAHDLNALSDNEFFRLWRLIPKVKSGPKQSGGNFHNTLPARNSVRFTKTLLSEVRRGRVLHRDAGRLLGVRPSTLPKLAKMRLGE